MLALNIAFVFPCFFPLEYYNMEVQCQLRNSCTLDFMATGASASLIIIIIIIIVVVVVVSKTCYREFKKA
jgi:hypothetical protein